MAGRSFNGRDSTPARSREPSRNVSVREVLRGVIDRSAPPSIGTPTNGRVTGTNATADTTPMQMPPNNSTTHLGQQGSAENSTLEPRFV